MTVLRELFLGLIYGLTSLTPFAARGQVWYYGQFFGMEEGYTSLFLGFMSLMTLLVVLAVSIKDVIKLTIGAYQLCLDVIGNIITWIGNFFVKEKKGFYELDTNPYKRQALLSILGALCAMVVRVLLHGPSVKCQTNQTFIAFAFLGTMVLLLLMIKMHHGKRPLKKMNYVDAVVIGALMGLGAFPGISSVALCLIGAVTLGFTESAAFRYYLFTLIPSTFMMLLGTVENLSGSAISLDHLGAMLTAGILTAIGTLVSYKMMKNASNGNHLTTIACIGLIVALIESIAALVF